VTVEASLGGEVLHRPWRVVLCWREGWLGKREEDGAAVHHTLGARVDQEKPNPIRAVRCGEDGNVVEPADERLWVADARSDVDQASEARSIQPTTGGREQGEAPLSPAPFGLGRDVEAHVVDHGCRGVPERLQLSLGPEWVYEQALVLGEEPFRQMDVPPAAAGPTDVLPGFHALSGGHQRIHVPVAEVADTDVAADAAWRRLLDNAAFDRVDPMSSARGRATFGPVVANRDVNAGVVDGPKQRVGPRVEKGASDRVLAVVRSHRPALERVVVALVERRHAQLPSPRRPKRRSAPGKSCGIPPECVHDPETATIRASGLSLVRR